jgi:IclR family KDG regulon transcriptional repressor
MKQTEKRKTTYRVQALDRAMDILDCFTFQDRRLTLSEVVLRTGLNKTTAKRILSNLTDRGYLQQDPQTKRYELGIRLFELGGIVFSSISLRKAASLHMTELRDATGLTVLLGIMLDDHLVYADKREGHGVIRVSSDIGWRRRLHFGMLGHVLMAYLPNEKAESILDKYPLEMHSINSITDRDAFSLRLAQIRQQGYVIEKEEAHAGIAGCAAPVHDYSREVVAAIGVAMPLSYDVDDSVFDDLVAKVKNAAKNISADLGYLKI